MAKKEFIGISSEYDRLRIARIRTVKGGIELLGVETLDMPYPIVKISDSSADPMDLNDNFDDLFSSQGSGGDFPGLDEPSEKKSQSSSGLDDDFDMTRVDEENEVASDNEKLLADYFAGQGRKKYNIGLHIPFGKTTYQFLKNVNLEKMKKNERAEFISEKLRPIHNAEPEPDSYTYTKTGDDSYLLAYNRNDHTLINLVEVAETYHNGKLLVHDRVPDESIWAGLVRANYNLEDDDITGVIAIGENSSRIIFMKGSHIHNILPLITDGENTEDILNTIFSKILFEIDKGDIPKITRLLVARSAKLSERVKSYFEEQLEDVTVDYLTLHPSKVSFADDIFDSPVYLQPYLTAIGAAWAASKANENELEPLSILPEYIREKQRVLKLAWHGIAILVLIALTPLYLNNMYQQAETELQSLEQDVRLVESQINEMRPIALMTEDLISDLQLIQSENERLLELARYSQKWSEVLRILNEGVSDIPQIWLTSLRTSDQNINLTGISLTREQIPVLARLFTDANVQQVSETELRGQQVYSFAMQTNNFQQDIEPFLLDMPDIEFDFEQQEEIELDFSFSPEPASEPVPDVTSPAVEQPEPGTQTAQNRQPQTNRVPEETSFSEQEETVENSGSNQDQPVPEPATATDMPESEEINASEANNSESPYGLYGQESEVLDGAYTIVLHSIPFENRARQEFDRLNEEGFKATLWQAEVENNQLNWRSGVGQFQTVSEALQAVNELPEPYRSDNFIIRIR